MYDAAKDADVIVILTEWSEFEGLDFDVLSKCMRTKNIFDCRDVLSSESAQANGFNYQGLGL